MEPEKYINPFTDYGFKRIFGTEAHKELLIDFLNQLLIGQETPIVDLTYLPTEMLGAKEYDRRAVFDLHCTTQNGDFFLVEMQMASHRFFKDRTLFYSTFPIQSQAKKGEWDFNLKKVYAIGILGFCFEDQSGTRPNEVKTVVQLHNSDSKELFYDKLNFIFLEMPKFIKPLADCETGFEKWLYVLKNLPQLERMPEKLMEQIFKKLFTVAEIAKLNVVEYHEYIQSRKAFWDNYSAFYTATEKGKEQGLELGIQQGLELGIQQGMEQGIQQGMEQGIQQGMEQGIQQGMEQGIQQGMEQGIQQGIEQGIQQGIEKGIQQGIEKGKTEGQIQGKLNAYLSLYQDGVLDSLATKSQMQSLLGSGFDDLVQKYLKEIP